MQHLEIVYSSPYDIIPTGDFNIDSGRILTVLNVIQLIVTDTPSTTIDHIFTTCAEMHYIHYSLRLFSEGNITLRGVWEVQSRIVQRFL